MNHQEDFTPYVCKHITQRKEWADKKGIQVTHYSPTTLSGTTSDRRGRISSINLKTMACTCQAREIQHIPCACQVAFILQTGNSRLLPTRLVHACFRASSWREALDAAIRNPATLGPCSSSSAPRAFDNIILFDWQKPIQPTPEPFGFPTQYGEARGRPGAPTQNRQLDIRPSRGYKRTFDDLLGVPSGHTCRGYSK